ncbi:hypothetical protein KP509_25G047700 [Ceratopteris richardii]|uniref:Uncharacterized protein n=1 Tax=Ceratopteris richardii TaxID=49495 RepID=A0A8T2RPU6_CERRI|nr:hypothetical protein KP509_25G047700 [Ceratopteris richardii]
MLPLVLIIGFAVISSCIIGGSYLSRALYSRCKKLPPGSLGWPFIGETIQLYSQNPNVFFSKRQGRYGHMFKTHILGCPCIMIGSPEAARFVLVKQAHLFKPTFPQQVIGPQAIFFHEGSYHACVRRIILRAFLPDFIRGIISEIEHLASLTLASWEGQTVNTFREMKKFTLKVGVLRIFGSHSGLNMDDLHESLATLEQGYNAMPFNISGTKYHRAMKARKQLGRTVQGLMEERRKGGKLGNDMLGKLMEWKNERGAGLTRQQIEDNVLGIMFASRDTTASVLTWLIKFLRSNPSLLDAVTEEHDSIRSGKGVDNLTWEDTKNMKLTSRVIQETLRVATILSFTFREAVEDVDYEGYKIPKGWKVLPLFTSIHHNPDFFPDPQKFDPSRFEVHLYAFRCWCAFMPGK